MGAVLEAAVAEHTRKMGYRTTGCTVWDAATGLVLRETEEPWEAEDWATDRAMSGTLALTLAEVPIAASTRHVPRLARNQGPVDPWAGHGGPPPDLGRARWARRERASERRRCRL